MLLFTTKLTFHQLHLLMNKKLVNLWDRGTQYCQLHPQLFSCLSVVALTFHELLLHIMDWHHSMLVIFKSFCRWPSYLGEILQPWWAAWCSFKNRHWHLGRILWGHLRWHVKWHLKWNIPWGKSIFEYGSWIHPIQLHVTSHIGNNCGRQITSPKLDVPTTWWHRDLTAWRWRVDSTRRKVDWVS